MLALSQLAKLKGWNFHYWIKPLTKFLKQNKNGNLKLALANGMQLFEITNHLNLESVKTNYQIENSLYFFDQGSDSRVLFSKAISKYCLFSVSKAGCVIIAHSKNLGLEAA